MWPKRNRENSLFDTVLNFGSLFDTPKKILPYLTLAVNFFPPVTLPSILLVSSVTFIFPRPNYPFLNLVCCGSQRCSLLGLFSGRGNRARGQPGWRCACGRGEASGAWPALRLPGGGGAPAIWRRHAGHPPNAGHLLAGSVVDAGAPYAHGSAP
jgi:hypothetical protein